VSCTTTQTNSMPPRPLSSVQDHLQSNTTSSSPANPLAIAVLCAWPVSGQYGPGSRILFYVLIAACLFARKNEWIRNACLAGALLLPSVAALHAITLAALHNPGKPCCRQSATHLAQSLTNTRCRRYGHLRGIPALFLRHTCRSTHSQNIQDVLQQSWPQHHLPLVWLDPCWPTQPDCRVSTHSDPSMYPHGLWRTAFPRQSMALW
jgi:hypothetical protein